MVMGGGLMMRTVAKIAGVDLVNTGIHSGVVPAVTPISAVARAVSRPLGAIAAESSSSTDSVKTTVAIDSSSSVEKPRWAEIDDWEFGGWHEEISYLTGSGDPLHRLVFGGPPTVEEAKKATDELKAALEKIYVSSQRSNGNESLHGCGHSSGLLSNTEVNENKVCLSSATPNHAIQAFRFLDQSPEFQEVVVSIASDPNVWNVVLQNPALQGYLQSNIGTSASVHQNVGESHVQGDIYYEKPPASFEVLSETGKSEHIPRCYDVETETGKSDHAEFSYKDMFLNFCEIIIKLAVGHVMRNFSDFFNSLNGSQEDFFNSLNGGQGDLFNSSYGVQGDDKFTGNSNIVEKMLMVVVMVIMVVLLKRV